MSTNPNAAAFPLDCDTDPIRDIAHHGMTKREYFAAMAMQGFASNSAIDWTFEQYAEGGLKAADALIAALNEVKP